MNSMTEEKLSNLSAFSFMGKPSVFRRCKVSRWESCCSAPSTSPTAYAQKERFRVAVILESFCLSDPAAVLRGFA